MHRLIEDRGLRFVLSGSSARKLRRRGVNLLAGRAVTTTMFPLVSAEVAFDFDIDRTLSQGTLPMAVAGDDPLDYLRTYAETYLLQEVQAEAPTRSLGPLCPFPRDRAPPEWPGNQRALSGGLPYLPVPEDVLCETPAAFVAIEIKAAARRDRRFQRGFHRVRQHLDRRETTCYGIYLGRRAALWG